jgi:hypothetical protein
MKIVNPPFSLEKFWKVVPEKKIEEIPAGATLVFKKIPSDFGIFEVCRQGEIPFGVEVSTLKEAIFVTNFGAKYFFTNSIHLADILQKYVDHYLLTTRVILIVDSLAEIEKVAQKGIDGIIEKKFYLSI